MCIQQQTNSLTHFIKAQLQVDKFYLAVETHQYGTTIPVILKLIFYSAQQHLASTSLDDRTTTLYKEYYNVIKRDD